MSFYTAINQILILFIIMFIGVVAKKTKTIDDSVHSAISALLIKIALPALVLSSTNFERSPEVIPNMIQIGMITLVYYLVIVAASILIVRLYKFDNKTASVFISLIVFANVGFMGYPVVRAFFQEIGVFYAAIVNLIFNVLLWTYGILLFNNESRIDFKKLINIGTISSIIAVSFFLLQIRLPDVLLTALDLTGKMTAPLSMILIGASIAEINFSGLFTNKKVFAVSFIRLLIIPVATAYILKALNFNSMVISICTIMAAMPAGATNAIFAKEFDVEPLFASVGVFISTLFSIITLPIIIYILTVFIL